VAGLFLASCGDQGFAPELPETADPQPAVVDPGVVWIGAGDIARCDALFDELTQAGMEYKLALGTVAEGGNTSFVEITVTTGVERTDESMAKSQPITRRNASGLSSCQRRAFQLGVQL
jgi:hypothetical protein